MKNYSAGVLSDVSLFLEEIRTRSGVSKRFLESARPTVERLFTKVSQENRSQYLEKFIEIAKSQAQTEAATLRALTAVQKILNKLVVVAQAENLLADKVDAADGDRIKDAADFPQVNMVYDQTAVN